MQTFIWQKQTDTSNYAYTIANLVTWIEAVFDLRITFNFDYANTLHAVIVSSIIIYSSLDGGNILECDF